MKSVITLNKYESGFYFVLWTAAVFYSIYNVYKISSHFINNHDTYDDFSTGWSWIGRKRDTSDFEWNVWIPFLFSLAPWIFVHCFTGQIIKLLFANSTLLCCWYITVSLVFLRYYVGMLGMLCMLVQPCISCLLTSFRSKTISWIVHLSCLAVINISKNSEDVVQRVLGLREEENYMLIIAICWIQLRSISYSIDSIVNYKHKNMIGFLKDLSQNAAYCLYLPTLFLGPLILYKDFVDGINKPFRQWNLKSLTRLLLNLIRYTLWIYLTELAMHFVYFNALQFHPEFVRELNPWAFYGYGYCMGQYFLNKYVVVYGISGEISRAEDIAAPPPPKCIGRIHLYSDMWKHFDTGLYRFLVRYIYIPVSRSKSLFTKLFGSFLCFGFVFLWHGMQMFIFIWSFLNFLGLSVENVARAIGNSRKYVALQRRYLTPRNARRFNCAIASPLLAISAISNFYFFAGQEIGNIFIYRLLYDPWKVVILLLSILYCCCQVSSDIKIIETTKTH